MKLFAVAVAVIAIVFVSLDQAGGPVTETTGTIVSLDRGAHFGSTTRLARVRLENGEVVLAEVLYGGTVLNGQIARVRVMRHVFSRFARYVVYQTI